MTPALPRSLDDHVLISRMARALRPLSELSLHWLRFSWYEVAGIDLDEARRLDVYVLAAELQRREVCRDWAQDARDETFAALAARQREASE